MELAFYDKENINRLEWSDDTENQRLFFEPLVSRGSDYYIKNSKNDFLLLEIEGEIIPVSVKPQKRVIDHSYLHSYRSQFFGYTKEEILKYDKYGSKDKVQAKYLFPIVSGVSNLLGIEKTVSINNFCLSTSLYPDLSGRNISLIHDELVKRFSDKAIVFKGVNSMTDELLMKELLDLGYKPIVCRQLYMLDPAEEKYKKKRPYQMDKKLWEKSESYYWDKAVDLSSIEIRLILMMYNKLYRKKYSRLNPEYTNKFVKNTCKSGVLDYYLLREKNTNQIKAVQAVFIKNNVLTTPFIGYDLEADKSIGLYRMMNNFLMELSVKNGYIFNMSSGASEFKKQRGGEPHFEYHMVYTDHISVRQKLVWNTMYKFSEGVVKPNMIKIGV